MRSKDFIREAGRNQTDEFGNSTNDSNAKRAETPDWLKNAGKWLGNKIGLKEPVALPDYTASSQQDAAAKSNYRGIDPVVRKGLGMAPATQQEIDAYMQANPAVVGNLVGRDGKPIASGGALDTERAARAAAPRRGADFDVDSYAGAPDPAAVGNRFYTPRELGFQPGGTMPAEKKAAVPPAAVVPPADSRISKVPPAAAPLAAAPPAAAPPAAAPPAAPAEPAPVAVASPVPAPVAEKPVALAPAEPAAAAGAAAKEPDARELERLTRLAGVSAGAPASGGSPTEFVRDKSQDAAGPTNRDSMSFKQAFADARASGEKTFMWKDKSYSTQLATPAPAKPDPRVQRFPANTPTPVDPRIQRFPANTPSGQNKLPEPAAKGPVSTGRQPWEHTPPLPEPIRAETPPPAQPNRGTNTKFKVPSVKESSSLQRMKFLAGLIKD
jgi:hypothetical protein